MRAMQKLCNRDANHLQANNGDQSGRSSIDRRSSIDTIDDMGEDGDNINEREETEKERGETGERRASPPSQRPKSSPAQRPPTQRRRQISLPPENQNQTNTPAYAQNSVFTSASTRPSAVQASLAKTVTARPPSTKPNYIQPTPRRAPSERSERSEHQDSLYSTRRSSGSHSSHSTHSFHSHLESFDKTQAEAEPEPEPEPNNNHNNNNKSRNSREQQAVPSLADIGDFLSGKEKEQDSESDEENESERGERGEESDEENEEEQVVTERGERGERGETHEDSQEFEEEEVKTLLSSAAAERFSQTMQERPRTPSPNLAQGDSTESDASDTELDYKLRASFGPSPRALAEREADLEVEDLKNHGWSALGEGTVVDNDLEDLRELGGLGDLGDVELSRQAGAAAEEMDGREQAAQSPQPGQVARPLTPEHKLDDDDSENEDLDTDKANMHESFEPLATSLANTMTDTTTDTLTDTLTNTTTDPLTNAKTDTMTDTTTDSQFADQEQTLTATKQAEQPERPRTPSPPKLSDGDSDSEEITAQHLSLEPKQPLQLQSKDAAPAAQVDGKESAQKSGKGRLKQVATSVLVAQHWAYNYSNARASIMELDSNSDSNGLDSNEDSGHNTDDDDNGDDSSDKLSTLPVTVGPNEADLQANLQAEGFEPDSDVAIAIAKQIAQNTAAIEKETAADVAKKVDDANNNEKARTEELEEVEEVVVFSRVKYPRNQLPFLDNDEEYDDDLEGLIDVVFAPVLGVRSILNLKKQQDSNSNSNSNSNSTASLSLKDSTVSFIGGDVSAFIEPTKKVVTQNQHSDSESQQMEQSTIDFGERGYEGFDGEDFDSDILQQLQSQVGGAGAADSEAASVVRRAYKPRQVIQRRRGEITDNTKQQIPTRRTNFRSQMSVLAYLRRCSLFNLTTSNQKDQKQTDPRTTITVQAVDLLLDTAGDNTMAYLTAFEDVGQTFADFDELHHALRTTMVQEGEVHRDEAAAQMTPLQQEQLQADPPAYPPDLHSLDNLDLYLDPPQEQGLTKTNLKEAEQPERPRTPSPPKLSDDDSDSEEITAQHLSLSLEPQTELPPTTSTATSKSKNHWPTAKKVKKIVAVARSWQFNFSGARDEDTTDEEEEGEARKIERGKAGVTEQQSEQRGELDLDHDHGDLDLEGEEEEKSGKSEGEEGGSEKRGKEGGQPSEQQSEHEELDLDDGDLDLEPNERQRGTKPDSKPAQSETQQNQLEQQETTLESTPKQPEPAKITETRTSKKDLLADTEKLSPVDLLDDLELVDELSDGDVPDDLADKAEKSPRDTLSQDANATPSQLSPSTPAPLLPKNPSNKNTKPNQALPWAPAQRTAVTRHKFMLFDGDGLDRNVEDPYATIKLPDGSEFRSAVSIKGRDRPKWNQTFDLIDPPSVGNIVLQVFDAHAHDIDGEKKVREDAIGTASLDLRELREGKLLAAQLLKDTKEVGSVWVIFETSVEYI